MLNYNVIKVYIFGIEMSQRIHFWYQLFFKCRFLEKMAKNNFLGVKKLSEWLQKQILR